jgi:hypothetical protein
VVLFVEAGRSRVRFFFDILLPGRGTALESTQPLTEMSTWNICFRVRAADA